MALEAMVNQALMRLRMIERALHSQEGWTFRCEGSDVEVAVEVGPHAIAFHGTLPGLCSVGEDLPVVHLVKDGDSVWAFRLDIPLGEDGTDVCFETSLGSLVGE